MLDSVGLCVASQPKTRAPVEEEDSPYTGFLKVEAAELFVLTQPLPRGKVRRDATRLRIAMAKVGVHVWALKGLKGFRYLDRRATFILEPRRPTQVIWRKGKGAIGIAWNDDEPIIANVENLRKRGTSQRLFCEIPRRD